MIQEDLLNFSGSAGIFSAMVASRKRVFTVLCKQLAPVM